MRGRPRLTVTDVRQGTRHPVDHKAAAEHSRLGEVVLHVVNVSAQGFMIRGELALERGERIEVQLPLIGRIEAHLVWSHDDRAGFQFERLIRPDDFSKLVDTLQPNPRLRP
ncbi:PilZ domain-containing protein [Novosphingobium sp. P6W]|uniref:PilZ domain-containing protein n=1 Tax=Novosphingobium sp. P6W TaxID=1609758 RepID=UPI0005C326BB|nr:PilZ domain-containing protein [Novosphingobium sp. P6W]AXB80702.1 PilZ domain-containing protein [Novosphingobium sp. P6W]KIS29518.1 pilus assembly protein PilZ [Novosphingobium sp. P6W]